MFWEELTPISNTELKFAILPQALHSSLFYCSTHRKSSSGVVLRACQLSRNHDGPHAYIISRRRMAWAWEVWYKDQFLVIEVPDA